MIASMTGLLDDRSDQDLQDLAAYFDSQDMPIGQADPDLVDQGMALYRGGNMASGVPACAGCHSPNGTGIEAAGYPRLSGQSAEYVSKQLTAYRDGERDAGQNASIMMDVAAKLTDQEISAVASYVSGLK
jgi:cytochrome c553